MTASIATKLVVPATNHLPALENAFSHAMAKLCNSKAISHIVLAVSGGADSMALTLLTHFWAKQHNILLTALTVDHGLRAEAVDEANQVEAWLSEYGITHHILTVDENAPSTGIQAWARHNRYRLMTGWCQKNHAPHLLVAHHEDDNIETYYMRKASRSGDDGLAGMSARIERDGITVLRPLLATPKVHLIEYLHAHNQPWLEDPSNNNITFTRNAIRATLRQTEKDEARKALAHYASLRIAREADTNKLLTHTVHAANNHHFTIDCKAWYKEEVIGKRALQQIVMHVGKHDVPPRSEKLDRLWQHLQLNPSEHSALRCLWTPLNNGSQWEVSPDIRYIKHMININKSNKFTIPIFTII